MSGLGQSAPPTDAPVVDTAEQVTTFIDSTTTFLIVFLLGLHFILSTFKNAQAWKSWSSYGGHGTHARGVC